MFGLFMIQSPFLLWPSLTPCFEKVISGASLTFCGIGEPKLEIF